MNQPRVYLTVPNGDGWIHKIVHSQICKMLADRRVIIRHDCPTHRPYVDNLHACMWDFLNGGEDFWLSIDDDNPPRNNPLDLVSLNLDLIGFPTPVWHNAKEGDRPWYFNALMRVGDDGYMPLSSDLWTGIQEVDAIGSGCFLVSRRVMLALCNQQPFMRQWGADGRVIKGCDYSFCDKVKASGFRIWAHFDYLCDHFNEINLLEVISAFNNMKTKAGNK